MSSTRPAAAIFATKTAAEWAEILAKHDCCVEVIVEPDGLPAHPLHVAREVSFTIDDSEGVGLVMPVRAPIAAPGGAHAADAARPARA